MKNVLSMCKHVIKLWYETGDALYLKSSLCCPDVSWLSVVSNNFEGEGLGLSQSVNTNLTLSDFFQMGCVKPDNTDVEPLVGNGCVCFAEASGGLQKHNYWIPTYGEACNLSSNAGFNLVRVGQHL